MGIVVVTTGEPCEQDVDAVIVALATADVKTAYEARSRVVSRISSFATLWLPAPQKVCNTGLVESQCNKIDTQGSI